MKKLFVLLVVALLVAGAGNVLAQDHYASVVQNGPGHAVDYDDWYGTGDLCGVNVQVYVIGNSASSNTWAFAAIYSNDEDEWIGKEQIGIGHDQDSETWYDSDNVGWWVEANVGTYDTAIAVAYASIYWVG